MFERYTDRARRAVILANEEARMAGQSEISTGHILLGLIHEGEGVAFRALDALGAGDLEAARDIVGRGHGAPPGHIPFTTRAKKVTELALREALQLGHPYVGTEHLLLGLVREGEGTGSDILVVMGLNPGDVRARVLELLHGYAEAEAKAGVGEEAAGDLAKAAQAQRIAEHGKDLDGKAEALKALRRSWELDDKECAALALADGQVWATLRLGDLVAALTERLAVVADSGTEGYLERRAAELARPLIEEAEGDAAERVLVALHEMQRQADLVAELRKTLEVRDRQVDKAADAANALSALSRSWRKRSEELKSRSGDWQRGYDLEQCAREIENVLRPIQPPPLVAGPGGEGSA